MGHPQALGMLQSGQGVCRLSRLRDAHHQSPRVRDRFAVPVLTGDLHLGGYFGDALQPILGRTGAVVTRPASQKEHAVYAIKNGTGQGPLTTGLHPNAALRTRFRFKPRHKLCLSQVKQLGHNPLDPLKGVRDRLGLFEYFFLHVMLIGPQLCGLPKNGQRSHDPVHRAQQCTGHRKAVQSNINRVTFFQEHELVHHPR